MERKDSKKKQHMAYGANPEDIISMIKYLQDILYQLGIDSENKKVVKLDPVRLKKNNEILRNGLIVLEKVLDISLADNEFLSG